MVGQHEQGVETEGRVGRRKKVRTRSSSRTLTLHTDWQSLRRHLQDPRDSRSALARFKGADDLVD